ncbi:MAG: UvrD-helicase domain-containing protein, partial [Thermus sp.]|uniref:UvrD-helicase domain-containing protein n=1 Tax=Thermus sp. TaxID=275 RepID=UPI0030AB7BB8
MSKKTSGLTLPDAEQRKKIVSCLEKNILVEASAGTGKTACLVERMVSLIRSGTCQDPSQLVGITFTRKAAEELKIRFREALTRALASADDPDERERLQRALGAFERCFLGTIHSFCARLLRERPVEAGVDPDFTEMDEVDERSLRKWAWRRFLRHLEEEAAVSDELSAHLQTLATCGISPDQLEGAFSLMADFQEIDHWPSGLEEARAADLASPMEAIAGFLRMLQGVKDRLPDDPGTDSFVPRLKRILRAGYRYVDRRPEEALEDKGGLIKFLEQFEGGNPERDRRITKWTGEWGFSREEADEILEGYKRAREAALSLLECFRAEAYHAAVPVLRRAMDFLSSWKRDHGLLGYQDLLVKTAELLRENPEARRALRDRYRFILVDEFQDTDPVQAEILFLLTSKDPHERDWRKCVPLPGSLFVVGDPKQSIYRFRRADIQVYREVKARFQESHGEILVLQSNFRSLPCLVEKINAHFAGGKPNEGSFLPFGHGDDVSPDYQSMSPTREEPPRGGRTLQGIYFLRSSGKKEDLVREEAELIARLIRRALDGEASIPSRMDGGGGDGRPRPEDFMILTWRKEELAVYAEALGRWGIPHTVSGGRPLKYNQPLRLLYLLLKATLRPEDPVPLVALLRSSLFGLSDRELFLFKRAGGKFDLRSEVPSEKDLPEAELRSTTESVYRRLRLYRRWLFSMTPAAAAERIAEDCGLFALAATEDREGLTSGGMFKAIDLLRLAGRLSASPYDCLELLEAYLE